MMSEAAVVVGVQRVAEHCIAYGTAYGTAYGPHGGASRQQHARHACTHTIPVRANTAPLPATLIRRRHTPEGCFAQRYAQ